MAYSIRVYTTKTTTYIPNTLDPAINVETRIPYLASLPVNPESPSDPYYWDIVDSDPQGSTMIVRVNTTDENHAILESDPDIIRIDNL